MLSTRNMIGMFFGATLASLVVAMISGPAQAAYRLDGSDTLTEVIKNAIAASGAQLEYHNTGSRQAERNMVGSPGFTVRQGIGPMSRNFTAGTLAANPSWAPTDANVVALDAGLLCVANIGGRCPDITVPLKDPANPALAAKNSDLSIILSGYPAGCTPGTTCTNTSKATTAECAHPERLKALARLTGCQGVNRIDHIYRLDDNSGTQDLFRERLQFDYWCNGKSEGNLGAAGSNLYNEDLDPIRRPCIGVDSTKEPSRCTYYPLKTTCTAGSWNINDPTYGNLKCTQGLVVALSENDPGGTDVTLSIANRVVSDLNGFTMGVIGHACVDVPGGVTAGTNINTVTYEDGNIRSAQYLLARRLFLMQNPNGPGVDSSRDVEEYKLFTWATNRCNMRNIVQAAGFLPPLPWCSAACTDPLNITCLQPDAGTEAPQQNIGPEATICSATSTYPCVADGAAHPSDFCPPIPVLASGYKCNLGSKCIHNTCNLDATLLSGVCQ